jgi:monofunctional glycosyltransferase
MKTMRTIGRVLLIVLAGSFAYAAYVYLTTPDVRALRTANPETTAFMELRAREAEARGEKPRKVHRWANYGRISSNLKRAVLVTEDSAFWQHDGIDLEQIKESMEINIERGTFARGGSTITQQLAKNLYLSPSKNPVRKIRELLIARRLESELSKQRILELYLNVIEWGEGIYGADAAARTYFGKPASALSAGEAALLAAAIQNPRLHNPAHPSARLRRRQQMVMRRMGAVTEPPVAAGPGAQVQEGQTPIASPDAPPAPVLPPSGAMPITLPGQVLPAPAAPAGRPGGGGI